MLSHIRIPVKIRNGRLKKVFDFYETLIDDYYNVAKDVMQDAKDKPVKATLVAGMLATSYAAYRTNPDQRCFADQLVQYVHDMGMVDPPIRHQAAFDHVHQMYRIWNERRMRRLNFIFFSVLWQDDFPPDSGHYLSQCQYLKPRITSFLTERVIDVGAFGRWRFLDHKLADYDVNPDEWDNNNIKTTEFTALPDVRQIVSQ